MKTSFLKPVVVALALPLFMVACKDENAPDKNSPAFQIVESEKMTIPAAVDLPSNLPGGNTRVATYFATGVQKYKAQVKAGTTSTLEWVLAAPVADLFDINNNKVGTHTAGPTWQLTGSTDSIYGQHFTPAKTAPSLESNTIDWLLLQPKAGKTPTGLFASVAYIQRIATFGGKAPLTAPASLNETADVPYTAVYRFTKKN